MTVTIQKKRNDRDSPIGQPHHPTAEPVYPLYPNIPPVPPRYSSSTQPNSKNSSCRLSIYLAEISVTDSGTKSVDRSV